jgi:diketogulonate reductase-like aldo/keto reductase
MESVSVQGVSVPALGFGTARMTGETCRAAVEDAIAIGYRHLDTAQMYDNEAAVGTAIANAGVDREKLFVVTKVHRRNLAFEDVLDSVSESLDRLGTDIDLLLIHAPSRSVPIQESIRAMNELQEDGHVRHIGVSNFTVDQLEGAIEASDTPILTNQVEYHPFNRQDELLEFCLDNEIMLTAYSPISKGDVVDSDTLRAIGDRYGKTPAQVTLRWLIQQDMVAAIPKAASSAHRRENVEIFDFALSDDDMDRIFELEGGLVGRLRRRFGL